MIENSEIDPVLRSYGRLMRISIHRKNLFLALTYFNLANQYFTERSYLRNYQRLIDISTRRKNLLLTQHYSNLLEKYIEKSTCFLEGIKKELNKFIEGKEKKKSLEYYKNICLFRNKTMALQKTPESPLAQFKNFYIKW